MKKVRAFFLAITLALATAFGVGAAQTTTAPVAHAAMCYSGDPGYVVQRIWNSANNTWTLGIRSDRYGCVWYSYGNSYNVGLRCGPGTYWPACLYV